MKEVSQVKSNITMTKVRFLFSCKCCIKPTSYDCSIDYLYQVKVWLVYGFSLFTFKLDIFFKKRVRQVMLILVCFHTSGSSLLRFSEVH